MEDWRSRLKAVIDDRDITLPHLAQLANYDYPTFWKALIKEKHTIKRSTMNRICQVLKVDPDFIWHGHEGAPVEVEVPIVQDDQLTLWVDGQISAKGMERVGTSYKLISARAFAWRSHSLEMASIIPVNSLVYFNPDMTPENGDLVLAWYHEQPLLRRFARVVDEQYLMSPDTGIHTYPMSAGDRVLAVAVGFYHSLIQVLNRHVKAVQGPDEPDDETGE